MRALAVAAVACAVLCAAASADSGVSCQMYNGIAVGLAAGAQDNYTISGELCATPSELANGETVQLLIHGATYDHSYWNFGTFDGVEYSYARDVAAAGYPTFAIDEIGTTHTVPIVPSADVTLSAVGYVAHEIVQDLLGGQIAGVKFGKVIEVGHSQGSFTSWIEASTFKDVAGVIITGAAHSTTVASQGFISAFHPAVDDPAFANSGLDPGYITSIPGTRGGLFYDSADSDPAVIAHDEATENVVSASLVEQDGPLESSSLTQQIGVPILVIMGGDDDLFCGAETNGQTYSCTSGQEVANEEAAFYSASAQLRACVVPGSGHDVNLASNHVLEEADALAWAAEYIGQRGLPPLRTRVLPPDCSSS